MFDLHFVVPVTACESRFIRRLEGFKKYGLLNVGDHKIKVTLLAGTEKIPRVEKDWPENVQVEVHSSPLNYHAAKVHHYFSSLTEDVIRKTKWLAKIDDDSITDVSAIIKNLEQDSFDYQKEYYVASALNDVVHMEEVSIMVELGFKRWFDPPGRSGGIWHEWEASLVSQTAMLKIINNETAMSLLRKRAVVEDGVTDYCLAIAAKICGIPPATATFMTKEPYIGDFSYFGGIYSHVHYVAPDCQNPAFGFLEKMIDKKVEPLHYELAGREFVLTTNDNRFILMIRLNERGNIELDQELSESFWTVTDGQLEFYTHNGLLSIRFKNGGTKFEGQSNFEPGLKFILKRIG